MICLGHKNFCFKVFQGWGANPGTFHFFSITWRLSYRSSPITHIFNRNNGGVYNFKKSNWLFISNIFSAKTIISPRKVRNFLNEICQIQEGGPLHFRCLVSQTCLAA